MFRSKKLLRTASPHDDESFIGYVIRLTEINYYDTTSWILQMAGLAQCVRNTAFVFNNSLSLAPLACLTSVDKTKLETLIYHPVGPTRRKMGNYRLFGSAVMQYLIRPDRPKICPYCIFESGYMHRMWEIIPVTTCPIHKCLLLDECPNCHARIPWNRKSISQCQCELDWRECQSLQVEDSELLVTEQIYRLCNLIPAKNKTGLPQSVPNPLYELNLRHFLSALIFVASQYGGFIDTKGKFIVSLKRNVEIHGLLCQAFSAFNEWPINFFSFLDWRREQMTNKKAAYGLRREFSEYKSVLYKQLSSRPLKFIRKAFEYYLATQWKGGYLGRMTRLSASARKQAKYLTMKEAKQLVGTSYVYELIEAGRLEAIVESQGNKKLVLIERASLNEFRWELEQALSMSQLCNLLAISPARVLELINAGLLNPLRGPIVDGLTKWKFSITEAKGLLAAFKGKAIQPDNTQVLKKLTLRAVLTKLDQYGVSFSKLLQAVMCGEVRPLGMTDERGLSKFFFSDEQITNFLRCTSQLHGEEGYSAAAVAKLLGSSKRTVWFLIRKGFIKAQRLSSFPSASLIVKKSELERFNATFLLIKDVASQIGTQPSYICELLIAQGIQPVLDPKIDRNSLIIFKRSDVEGIDLISLVSIARSKGRIVLPSPLKRLGPVTLSEREAADALGINVEIVEHLVQRGVLKQHRYRRPSKESADKYYFSVGLIEKWKKQPVNCTGVVSFLMTAKLIGSRPDNFYNRYVRTGRLKPVITGKQRSEIYFEFEDVEAAIKLKEQTITVSEAAAICKVTISCLQKLTVAGDLNPVSGPNVDGFGHNLYLRTDVERLQSQRDGFKARRYDEGRTTRFGKQAGPRRSPVQERVSPRINQLVRQWEGKSQGRRISGQRVHSQLIKEGYQVGINTVYVCLRELRQRGIPLI